MYLYIFYSVVTTTTCIIRYSVGYVKMSLSTSLWPLFSTLKGFIRFSLLFLICIKILCDNYYHIHSILYFFSCYTFYPNGKYLNEVILTRCEITKTWEMNSENTLFVTILSQSFASIPLNFLLEIFNI